MRSVGYNDIYLYVAQGESVSGLRTWRMEQKVDEEKKKEEDSRCQDHLLDKTCTRGHCLDLLSVRYYPGLKLLKKRFFYFFKIWIEFITK